MFGRYSTNKDCWKTSWIYFLQCIFHETYSIDFHIFTYQVQRPPEFILKLSPQANYDSESGNKPVACKLDLHIKFSTNYPNSTPSKLEPINIEGLSQVHIKELKRELVKEMEELKGNEMVMEIAQKVSAWLAAQNKAMLGKKNPFSSFYEEMVSFREMGFLH